MLFKKKKQPSHISTEDTFIRSYSYGYFIPAGWEETTNLFVINGPVDDALRHTIGIAVEKDLPFDDLKQYSDWHLDIMNYGMNNFSVQNEESIELACGQEAYRALIRWFPSMYTYKPCVERYLFVYDKPCGYVLKAVMTEKTVDKYLGIVDAIMMSFRLNNFDLDIR